MTLWEYLYLNKIELHVWCKAMRISEQSYYKWVRHKCQPERFKLAMDTAAWSGGKVDPTKCFDIKYLEDRSKYF